MAFRPPCEMEKGAESGRENPNACGHQIIFVALSSAHSHTKKEEMIWRHTKASPLVWIWTEGGWDEGENRRMERDG